MAIDGWMMEVVRAVLLFAMIAIAGSTLLLSRRLNRRIQPLARQLLQAHQGNTDSDSVGEELQSIKARYIDLLEHVDDVDASEFSAGEIERLALSFLNRELTAASAQSWIRQAPGILISLGLLGTFTGLTVGLSQISGVLSSNLNPAAAMGALSGLVTPMGTAFETSLIGLLLSLIVLIWTQITGTRTCLESCESLLSSWLETVLPRQLGRQIMMPLRQALADLNRTSQQLPEYVFAAVQQAMQQAFAAKLNDIFNRHADLASEAQTAVRTLSSFASSLNESGQDFVEAAQAFRQSDFAATLESSVQGLIESREQLSTSTNALSNRLMDVQDQLMSTQAEWQLIAKASEQELAASRSVRQQIQEEICILHTATQTLQEGIQTATEAAKQLREARLEVMRDRKLAIEIATAVQQRLNTDHATAESCRAFALALEVVLNNWNQNVERLNELSAAFIEEVRQSKLESDDILLERSRLAKETIAQLRNQMQNDLSLAIEAQRSALVNLAEPARSAESIAQSLLRQMEQLQARISGINGLSLAKRDSEGK